MAQKIINFGKVLEKIDFLIGLDIIEIDALILGSILLREARFYLNEYFRTRMEPGKL